MHKDKKWLCSINVKKEEKTLKSIHLSHIHNKKIITKNIDKYIIIHLIDLTLYQFN